MSKKIRLSEFDFGNPELIVIRDKFGSKACKVCMFCGEDFEAILQKTSVAIVVPLNNFIFAHYFDKHVRPYLEFKGNRFDWRWEPNPGDEQGGHYVYSVKNGIRYDYKDYLQEVRNIRLKDLKRFELMRKLYVGK